MPETPKCSHKPMPVMTMGRASSATSSGDQTTTPHRWHTHTYAQAQYVDLVAAGHTQIAAELHVSKLLGHTRPEVTRIYLAGLSEE
jgi:hypothetical protein